MAQKEKRCSKCGNLKFIDQFSKNASTGDGLERWCKDCKKKQGADYRDRKKKSGNGRKRRMASKPRSLPGLSPKIDDAIFLDQETIAGLQRAVAKKIINVIEKAFL